MILISPQKLEQQLASESISTWEKAKYLVLAVVVAALAGPLFWITPVVKEQHFGRIQLVDMLASVVGVYITYKGIRKCYDINEKEDAFIERFICLRVPWTILFGVILAPLSFGLILIIKKVFPDNPDLSGLIIAVLSPVITVLYYWALITSFRRINLLETKDPAQHKNRGDRE
jgi:hypothetical protein